MTHDELAERCEKATVDQQREMLWQSWQVIHGSTAVLDAETANQLAANGNYWSFVKKLDAQAYESAAMMLVPEGLSPTLAQNIHYGHWIATCQRYEAGCILEAGKGGASTGPLALCAAALRAQERGK